MNCSVCSKEGTLGFIVFYELYNELLDKEGAVLPMGCFCSMRCASTYTAQAVRLESKAARKKK